MGFLNLEQLPFVGMSHEFVGEKEGAPFSAYIVTAKPGQGPSLHKHPYVEVAFTIEEPPRTRSEMKNARCKQAASLSFPRIHRIDSLTPARASCVRSTSTRVRDLSRQILLKICVQSSQETSSQLSL